MIALAGCASPQLESRDQWLAESQRLYSDRNSEQVIRAAEALIKHINPGQVTFVHNLDGFTATRSWFVYLVLIAVDGTDALTVNTAREAGGTRVTLKVERKTRNSEGGRAEGAVSFAATYRHFFANLDYALGKRHDWVTCQQASEKLGIENAAGASALCGPGITPQMGSALAPQPEWTRVERGPTVVPGTTRQAITTR